MPRNAQLYYYIVTSKTVAMFDSNAVREAHCKHKEKSHQALLERQIVYTLGYIIAL